MRLLRIISLSRITWLMRIISRFTLTNLINLPQHIIPPHPFAVFQFSTSFYRISFPRIFTQHLIPVNPSKAFHSTTSFRNFSFHYISPQVSIPPHPSTAFYSSTRVIMKCCGKNGKRCCGRMWRNEMLQKDFYTPK
jgi:hypothetical protein